MVQIWYLYNGTIQLYYTVMVQSPTTGIVHISTYASSDFKVVCISHNLYLLPQLVALHGQRKAELFCAVFLVLLTSHSIA